MPQMVESMGLFGILIILSHINPLQSILFLDQTPPPLFPLNHCRYAKNNADVRKEMDKRKRDAKAGKTASRLLNMQLFEYKCGRCEKAP